MRAIPADLGVGLGTEANDLCFGLGQQSFTVGLGFGPGTTEDRGLFAFELGEFRFGGDQAGLCGLSFLFGFDKLGPDRVAFGLEGFAERLFQKVNQHDHEDRKVDELPQLKAGDI